MIWSYEDNGYLGLIGFANDGIAGVPGVLRATVQNENGEALKSGCLDAGYPLPGKIRQAQFVLPRGTKWQGLRLKTEIDVKGMRYPVRWACHQELNDDGSLTLRSNLHHTVSGSVGLVVGGPYLRISNPQRPYLPMQHARPSPLLHRRFLFQQLTWSCHSSGLLDECFSS